MTLKNVIITASDYRWNFHKLIVEDSTEESIIKAVKQKLPYVVRDKNLTVEKYDISTS